MSGVSRERVGVVLVNLGTPDAPTPAAVRRYLREFLSDRRVIEMPRLLWWLILNLFVLTFRPRRVARLYQSIWRDGDSPMRLILREQARLLQEKLALGGEGQGDVQVLPAMSYGQPALTSALDTLQAAGVGNVVVLPLFPQYSATSTAPVYDIAGRWLARQRDLPAVTLLKDYHQHPAFIAALAASVREFRQQHGPSEKLLLSFHGIPQPYAERGDPYPQQCRATADALAAALDLPAGSWAFSFQSRFGAQQWVQPYTDVLLAEWAKAGVRSVQVLCPAFSADCLETLEEIAEQNRGTFLHAGGQEYRYIPALNARADHIDMMAALLHPHLQAYRSQ